jgi:DNA invertase Pin-like site-specific DNA recombinase
MYLRVSTDDQTPKSQRYALEVWLQNRPATWYVDQNRQGDAKRPKLDKLLSDLQPGDTAVCFALDRMSRGGILETLQLQQQVRQAGAKLISLTEPWIADDHPCADVVIAVLAWAAQFEKKRIKRRQREGIDAAMKANGGKAPWGGRKVGTRITVTVEKEELVRQLVKDGRPIAVVARAVGLSRKTIYKVLGSEQSCR